MPKSIILMHLQLDTLFIYFFFYLFIYVLCLCTLLTEAECLKKMNSVAWHNDKTRNFNRS